LDAFQNILYIFIEIPSEFVNAALLIFISITGTKILPARKIFLAGNNYRNEMERPDCQPGRSLRLIRKGISCR
jgi:hypothetical protein